jgi:beta-xylosidase
MVARSARGLDVRLAAALIGAVLLAAGVWLATRPTAVDPDYPDPFVLELGGEYHAYTTEDHGATVHLQLLRSADLETWRWLGDALPTPPDWAAGLFWAPSVLPVADELVLYYAAVHALSGLHCIGTAVAADPAGPFVGDPEPLVCQSEHGGAIDPNPFVEDDGTAYLLWKTEGRFGGIGVDPPGEGDDPMLIWAQELSRDGRGLVGTPTPILGADQDWEGGIVEAPSMTRHEGGHVLVYSGNLWSTADYAIGWAMCTSPLGPCTKPDEVPLLASDGNKLGPGGSKFFTDVDGRLRLSYHAWRDTVGYPNGGRKLHIAAVRFDGARPVLEHVTSQPATVLEP